MDISTYLRLHRDFVKYSGDKNKPMETFRGFVLMRTQEEMDAENWGKNVTDRNSPNFYSSLWQKKGTKPSSVMGDYPALGLVINSLSEINKREDEYVIERSAVYPNISEVSEDYRENCALIKQEEIYPAMRRLLKQLDYFMSKVIYADVAGVQVWQSTLILDVIGDPYTTIQPATALFQRQLQVNNKKMSFGFYDDEGAHKHCGVYSHITFTQPCQPIDFIVEMPKDCCTKNDFSLWAAN